MSFADYGYNVFSYNPLHDDDAPEFRGDCVLPKNVYEGDSGKSCYHVIIDHLIDLGSCTESELAAAKSELARYKALRLTHEQIEQLRKLGVNFNKHEDIGGSRALITINLNDSSYNENINHQPRDIPGISLIRKNNADSSDVSCCSRKAMPSCIDRESFRATIIQKDSEIISLKNENAAKETELRELEEQNKDLEMIIDKMKDDIDLLESSSKISQSQIERIVKQKNEEIDISRENSERLGQELQEERQTRLHVEKQIEKLQNLLQEAQALRKNLTDELSTMKRRVQALECSNASHLAMMKQLQKERDGLDQLNCEHENEIEKLLKIINGISEKYRLIKVELTVSKDELIVREQKLTQCRNQLETMEREVGKLIGDLAHCLGGAGDEQVTEDVYARARQLTRGLVDVVKEHEQCRVQRETLIKEIDRQKAINLGHDPGGITEIESANRELARLKRAVMPGDHTKVELKRIRSDVIVRVDSRRFERTEQACLKLASEASQALQKLDQTISEHDIYRKCESFLLLELENLQEALNGAEKTISGLDLNAEPNQVHAKCPFEELEEKRKKLLEESGNNSIVESVLSKQLLQRVQTSTQIVVRITSALREDTISKLTYNKKLEEQLQQALAALNEVGVEKCQLENEYNECKNQCRELDAEVDKLQAELSEKTQDLQSLGKKMQARLDHFRKENDQLRKQLTASERRYQDSRAENAALIKKSDEVIEALHREGQTRDLKLQEYSKLNDYLTCKLEEAKAMLEQQQRAIVQETMRSIDLEGFNARYDAMLQLARDKEELTERMAIVESQLGNLARANDKLQRGLGKTQEENDFLEKCIESVKRDNERMEASATTVEGRRCDLADKCDKLLERIESINRFARPCRKPSEALATRGLEKEIKSYKEKLRYQQKELLMREKEIIDQNKKIEQLQRAKDDSAAVQAPLLKQIESLTRDKCLLDNELKQTQQKYEDKLAEMHRQYKHHETELLRSHNDSIKRLEAKYAEIEREEEIGSQTWLQSLSAAEVQQLHDKICKSPLCPSSTYERDLHEQQRKMQASSSRGSLASYGSKRPLPAKKGADARSVKSSTTSSRPKLLVAEKDVSARGSRR